jgi:hypothetical protein
MYSHAGGINGPEFSEIYTTVGYCTSGDAAGLYIAIAPIAGLHDPPIVVVPRSQVWEAWFSGPVTEIGLLDGDVLTVDLHDEATAQLLEGFQIRSVPRDVTPSVLASLFPAICVPAEASTDHSVTGRFRGGKALGDRLQTLLAQRRIIPGQGAPIRMPSGEMLDALENSLVLEVVSELLSTANLALAVVPVRGPLVMGDEEHPWKEFTG